MLETVSFRQICWSKIILLDTLAVSLTLPGSPADFCVFPGAWLVWISSRQLECLS